MLGLFLDYQDALRRLPAAERRRVRMLVEVAETGAGIDLLRRSPSVTELLAGTEYAMPVVVDPQLPSNVVALRPVQSRWPR